MAKNGPIWLKKILECKSYLEQSEKKVKKTKSKKLAILMRFILSGEFLAIFWAIFGQFLKKPPGSDLFESNSSLQYVLQDFSLKLNVFLSCRLLRHDMTGHMTQCNGGKVCPEIL